MIDNHCHLNFKAFEEDLDEVVRSAFEKSVEKIISVGSQISSSKKAVEIAEKFDNIYAAVGIHPHHADKLESNWEKELTELAQNPKVVAIGECGMDYFNYQSNGITDPKLQKELFVKQIEIAYNLKLPLQIHNRHAGKDVIEILESNKSNLWDKPGVFHCFAGEMDILKKALNLGFYIGFDGNITYKGIPPGETTDLKDLAKYTPIDRILTETDSPYLAPIPYRGKKNKPEYVIIVGEFIARLKGLEFEDFKKQTVINSKTLFKF